MQHGTIETILNTAKAGTAMLRTNKPHSIIQGWLIGLSLAALSHKTWRYHAL